MSRKRNTISGQFSARLIEMIESPAYRVLSLSAHRVLSRIEIEHAHHGGNENGQLPVTYGHFEEYGIHHHAIGPAIRELVALGFIAYDKGTHGNGVYRVPNKFRLTYRPIDGERGTGSHEWRRIKTLDGDGGALAIAEAARNGTKKEAGKSISPVPVSAPHQCRFPAVIENSPVPVSGLTVPAPVSDPTSIFRDIVEGEGALRVVTDPAGPPRPKPRKPYGSTKRNMPPAPMPMAA